MVMVMAGGVDELVASDPVTHVEPIDEIVLLQQLEHAVHARPPHAAHAARAAPERILDLQRAERTVLSREQLDQLITRRALVMAGLPQHLTRVVSPLGASLPFHRAKDSPGCSEFTRSWSRRLVPASVTGVESATIASARRVMQPPSATASLIGMSSTPDYKQCPDCAEHVLAAARKCRFCGYRFDGRRKARPSLLSILLPGLTRDMRDATLPEVLADWGVSVGDTEEVALFRLAEVDDRPGYLLVTSERLVFFGQASRGEHERALEYPLDALTEVIVQGGRCGDASRCAGPTSRMSCRAPGARISSGSGTF
jgi:hypothetical protein